MDVDLYEVEFTLTPKDFRAMMRAYWKMAPARLWGVVALRGLTLMGAALAAFSWWESGEGLDAVLAVALLLTPLAVKMLNRNYYDGVFRKQRLGAGATRVKIGADGVSKSNPNGTSRFAWKQVWRVENLRRHILLWISPDQAIIVPKRAFADPGDTTRLLDFARAKVAGRKTSKVG